MAGVTDPTGRDEAPTSADGTPDAEASTAGEERPSGLAVLVLGAVGVAFGDIGTSPLYAMKTVFYINDGAIQPTPVDVYGIVSLVFWSLTLVVSVKYVTFILRADNDGEGGVLALAYLARQRLASNGRRRRAALVLGVLGASLFYGDSLITPAISVLSAVEGIEVSSPEIAHLVIPIGVAVLTALFLVQRFGTHAVGRAFGPVMVLWFLVLAALGIGQVVRDPAILKGLSPTYAFAFVAEHPGVAFLAMGAVVLVITGAEALYADMGHFGPSAIRVGWFALVFPALTLNYLGQAAAILENPKIAQDPFFLIAPDWSRVPLVVLATMATVIASQAVIAGAFSMTRQGIRLGLVPRMTILQTSRSEGGQVYLPAVNWAMYAGVLVLLITFRSSARLATAYGVAVTGMFLITTTLFLLLAHTRWQWSRTKLLAFAVPIYLLEVTYFTGNLAKIVTGGWLPLLVATVTCTLMLTWWRGRRLAFAARRQLEGNLLPFVDRLHEDDIVRVPGTAVFLHQEKATTPLALRQNAEVNHVVHEHVWIVATESAGVPFVPPEERVTIDRLGDEHDEITHLTLHFGFKDDGDVPAALRLANEQDLGIHIDVDNATYFVSRATLSTHDSPGIRRWRTSLFLAMARGGASPAEYYHLPVGQVVVMGTRVFV